MAVKRYLFIYNLNGSSLGDEIDKELPSTIVSSRSNLDWVQLQIEETALEDLKEAMSFLGYVFYGSVTGNDVEDYTTFANFPNASEVPDGTLSFASDEKRLYAASAGTWCDVGEAPTVIQDSVYATDEGNTATTPLSMNVWAQIVVSPTAHEINGFTHDGAGVFTYTGATAKKFKFTAAICQKGDDNDRRCEFAWFKNDATQMAGMQCMDMNDTKFYGTVSPYAVTTMNNGDNMRICMRNTESNDDTEIRDVAFIIEEWR